MQIYNIFKYAHCTYPNKVTTDSKYVFFGVWTYFNCFMFTYTLHVTYCIIYYIYRLGPIKISS